MRVSSLSERERVGLGAGLEECDLQRPLADRGVLAHQLVQAALPEQAVPVLVYIHAVRRARSLAVEAHAEGNRLSCFRRQDEMRVTGVEAVGDAPAGLGERDVLTRNRP